MGTKIETRWTAEAYDCATNRTVLSRWACPQFLTKADAQAFATEALNKAGVQESDHGVLTHKTDYSVGFVD